MPIDAGALRAMAGHVSLNAKILAAGTGPIGRTVAAAHRGQRGGSAGVVVGAGRASGASGNGAGGA